MESKQTSENKTQDTRVKEAMLSLLLAYKGVYMENEDQVNMTCLLYPSLLKGGPTLKLP